MITAELAPLDRRVRIAARALARHGLVQAWGHCSARIDDERFIVCAARPMGRIGVGEAGTVVHIGRELPAGVLGEVRVHQQIYRLRADVGGICRIMPPLTMALSTLGRVPTPRHGVGAFNAACRYWDDPRLLRDDGLAAALAAHLGDAPSLVMRANGAVTVGPCIEVAAGFAWCLEDAARIEHLSRTLVDSAQTMTHGLTAGEISSRQVSTGAVFERLWDFMAGDDPESAGDSDTGVSFPAPQWGTAP